MRMTKGFGLLAAAVLMLGACGDDDPTTTEEPEQSPAAEPEEPAEPAEEPDPDESDPEEAEPTVAVADSEHGTILVDEAGLSLYMFDPDEQGASTCYGDCEAAWPPLVVDADPVAGEGVDESLLGTTERDDGTVQVTYNDWPLYYWASDASAGDVAGQGVQGVWWVVAPDGEPIRG